MIDANKSFARVFNVRIGVEHESMYAVRSRSAYSHLPMRIKALVPASQDVCCIDLLLSHPSTCRLYEVKLSLLVMI